MSRLPTSRKAPVPLAHNRSGTPLALLALALVPLLGVPVTGAAVSRTRNALHQEVIGYKNDRSDIGLALQDAADKYGVPLGIETDVQGLGVQHTPASVPKGTVADVFNALVEQAPNYRWVEIDGVVNVVPKQNRNSVLDVTIARFGVRNAVPLDVDVAIESLPEVKAWLSQNRLVASSYFAGSIIFQPNGKSDQPRVSLSAKNKTLREILNAIVKKPRYLIWLVGPFFNDSGGHLEIEVN